MAYGQVDRKICRVRLRDGRRSNFLCDPEGLVNRRRRTAAQCLPHRWWPKPIGYFASPRIL